MSTVALEKSHLSVFGSALCAARTSEESELHQTHAPAEQLRPRDWESRNIFSRQQAELAKKTDPLSFRL
jgi:hypothetical protein